MPVQQTVFINIVVKGSTAAVNTSMGQTTAAANSATTAVNNVNTAVANTGTVSTHVSSRIMAFGSTLRNMGDVVGNFVMRQINTLIKAVTSMIGVMAIYTTIITIPEMLAKGFIALTKAALDSADAIMQSKITINALLASVMDFRKGAEESFKAAGMWVDQVYLKFVRLSAESILTVDEMLTGYQAFLAGGGAQLTKTLDEQVKLSSLLSQTIVTLTGRMGGARQQFSEMRALLAGENIAGAQLVKWLMNTQEVMQAGGIKQWIKHIKESKDGVEEFTRLLGAFNEAAKAQGLTFTGLTTAIGDYVKSLNTAAITGGIFKTIQAYLINVRNVLGNTITELGNAKNGVEALSGSSQLVVDAFTTLNATLQTTLIMLLRAANIFVEINDPARTLNSLSMGILTATATVAAWVQGISNLIVALKSQVEYIYHYFVLIAEYIKLAALYLRTWKVGEDDTVGQKLKKDLDAVKAAIEVEKQIIGSVKAKIPGMFDSAPFDVDKFRDNFIRMAVNAMPAIQEALRKAFIVPPVTVPNAKTTPDVISEQQLRALERATHSVRGLQKEFDLLLVRGDELATIEVTRNYQAEELVHTLKEYPELLKAGLALITQITAEELKQLQQRKALNLALAYVSAKKEFTDLKESIKISTLDKLQNAYKSAVSKTMSAVEVAEVAISQMWSDIVNDTIVKDERLIHVLTALIPRFNEVADAMRSAAKFKDLISGIDTFIDRNRLLVESVRDDIFVLELAKSGFATWSESIKAVAVDIDSLRLSIEVNNKALTTLLWLSNFASGEALEKLMERIRQLQRETRNLNKELLNTVDALVQALSTWPDITQEINRFLAVLLTVEDTALVAKFAVRAIGSVFAEMIAGLVAGTKSVGALLKGVLADILNAFASYIMARGLAAIAEGGWPPNPVAISAGIAMMAAAGVLRGIAAILSSSSGGGATSSSAGHSSSSVNNTQTIYLEPYFQRQDATLTRLNSTLDRLEGTISNFDTKSPGLIVKEGAALAGPQLTSSVNSTLQKNVASRVNMSKTLLGEGY